ncbi:putative MAGE-like protein 2 [Iris pallida]|uniref:MAGE-like protein 2 n=1 Tax=Iris pallida TaxID=29817 RepID=A0AAX6E2A7_IRIPA|nr:putative MAGE-like protein 2 [Iris pallida]
MASSSSTYHDKSSVVTGYPAGPANGIDPTANFVATAAASTAYPYYPNPNPSVFYYSNNPNPNNSYYYQNPNPNPNPNRSLLFRRLLIIFISIFLAFGAVTLIVYIVLRPKLPTFSLSSLNVTNFNLSSSSSLSSSFDLSLSVYNPNSKMTVGYDRVLADVAVDGDPVASTYLAPFIQPKGNSTTISAKMTAANVFVDSYVVDAIRSGSGSGVVRLDVRAVAVVRFWSGAWRTRRHELRVFCGDVEVKFRNGTAGDGAMTGGPWQCWVGI